LKKGTGWRRQPVPFFSQPWTSLIFSKQTIQNWSAFQIAFFLRNSYNDNAGPNGVTGHETGRKATGLSGGWQMPKAISAFWNKEVTRFQYEDTHRQFETLSL
jgi:hypothetical protein